MPIVHFHLVEKAYSDEQCEALMVESSRLYAQVLHSPIERVRVFVNLYSKAMVAVGGLVVSRGAQPAPYFEFVVLSGRPLDERQRLIVGFTDLVESILGVERSVIRGACWTIPAEDWGIGGVPASMLRSKEVLSRSYP